MAGVRVLCLACLAILLFNSSVSADMPAGPWPWSGRQPRADRTLIEVNQKLIAEGKKEPIKEPIGGIAGPENARSGPFRSCGSGVGVGLAGIGLASGFMWAGHRFANRMANPRS